MAFSSCLGFHWRYGLCVYWHFFHGDRANIDMFNLPVFLFITPMFLFSGTFFPLENLPGWAQDVALLFPSLTLPISHALSVLASFRQHVLGDGLSSGF